jgi:HrpA-like RNA helicase
MRTPTGKSKVVVTQPRRVAAITLAQRVAEEMGSALGDLCGYSIRFDDCTCHRTQVKFCTDGILLQELISDAALSEYSVVVLDEAHERSLHTDILFALVKRALALNPHVHIVVMSATLQADRFLSFFSGAAVAYIEGRTYPVQTFYASEGQRDYLDAATTTVLQIHSDEPLPGDILVFLPGQEEIETVQRLLESSSSSTELLICPLYAALSSDLQLQVFAPTPQGKRKVVLSTNIAETSVTLSGVCFVVDTGLAKMRTFFPRSGLDTLLAQPISRAAARQRQGRAGRDAPGKCFRLYTEDTYMELLAETIPEIKRTNMAHVVLQLKALGLEDVLALDFLDAPPRETMVRALMTLYALEALDASGKLTDMGRKMAKFPLEPMAAKALLSAASEGCLEEMLGVVAMLSVDGVYVIPPADKRAEAEAARRGFADVSGDHLTLLNVLRDYVAADKHKAKSRNISGEFEGSHAWCRAHFINDRAMKRALEVRQQLRQLCVDSRLPMSTCGHERTPVLKALAAGFFLNAAIRFDGASDGTAFKTMTDHLEVRVHPSGVLSQRLVNAAQQARKRARSREARVQEEEQRRRPTCIIYAELVQTSQKYVRTVTEVEQSMLLAVAPRYFGMLHDAQQSPPTPSK